MEYTLSQETIKSIENAVGLSYDEIISMDVNELDVIIEKKIDKKLEYSLNDLRVPVRGDVYLFNNRFFDLNKKQGKLFDYFCNF